MKHSNYYRYYFEAIGSGFEIELIAQDIDLMAKVKLFEEKVRKFEKRFSRFDKESEVFFLNENVGKVVKVSSELRSIIENAERYRQTTDGYFSIGVEGTLAKLGYGVKRSQSAENVPFGVEFTSEDSVKINSTIDLGGIGKGMMLDWGKEEFSDADSVMINAGGDMYLRGEAYKGGLRRIYFENPFDLEEYWGYLDVEKEAFLASSNASKRRWASGHHLVNPVTGDLADDMGGVYVQGKTGESVDVISTALYAMGYEKAKDWLGSNFLVEAALISKEGLVFKTNGFKGEILKN